MATPDPLYGWFPGNQQIPAPATSPQFTGGPLSQLAYDLANKPKTKPGAGVLLPYSEYPDDGEGNGAIDPQGILGNVDSANSLYKNGKKLADMISGGGSAAGASGAAAPIDLSAVGSAGLGSIGAGAMFGSSGAAALGATAPIAADAALANLGTVTGSQLFGGSASAAVGSAPGSLGAAGGTSGLGSSGAGAAGSSSGGLLAGSGIGTALPLAVAMFAAADMLNAAGDKDSLQVTQWLNQLGTTRGVGAKQGYVTLPDGRLIRADKQAEAAARAYFNGDASYTDRLNEWLATAKTPKGG